ncbi:MAG: dihydrolipoyl dehydrogenase [Acidobacteria bacterium]|nr:dihydrolipoyl dehydrogenase [Acidobacteriota bacterium]
MRAGSASVAEGYDLVVIGSGTGGYVTAIRAAQLGLKTALVERQPALGGTCLNLGCIPTKALVEHAHAFTRARHAADWGIRFGGGTGEPSIDLGRVHERKNAIVAGLTKGVEYLCRKHRIDVVRGTGRFAAPGLIEVAGDAPRELSAREVVIATGSAPRPLPGIEIDRRIVITSDEAIHLSAVPSSVAIVGSGAVGVEFASIFRQLGSDVTLIELQPRLVPGEDEAVSALLERAFRKRGIGVRTSTTIESARVEADRAHLQLKDAAGAIVTLTVETLLVAAGRRPVTDGLGAEAVGIALEDGFIPVDEWYRTAVPGVSAIGDVIAIRGRRHPQLAHVASAEGILVAERLAGREPQPLDYDQVPVTTYCDPEIGSVGLSEAEAAARGREVRVGTFPFSALGRAKLAGETDGFVKIVADAEYDQVLGVHIVGPRATELIGEAVVAIRLESTAEELTRVVHAHPTMSEAIGEAAYALHGGAIHL